jgi:lipopolysaccharide transport system ATP-binding protein
MSSIITVENLSKKFIISHEGRERYTSLRDVMAKKAKNVLKVGSKKEKQPSKEEFWALKDLSFTIEQGDRAGIIGRNGAGKSTLLKILSRITEPTSGRIAIRGRVASLLEVGTGFHPELTGRENIFLNGAILGMSRGEIRRKFDEIVDFAEVEQFLDTPVKRYSSGMYVRLAFSVAAHLEPEILIVDEVLAVGDALFQKKCLGKMEDVSKGGRTVLFVSHNMTAIQSLCNKGIFLNQGKLVEIGNAQNIILNYISTSQHIEMNKSWTMDEAPGDNGVKVLKAAVVVGDESGMITLNTPFYLEFEIVNLINSEMTILDITYHLVDEIGILVYVGSTGFAGVNYFPQNNIIKAVCAIPGQLLNEGRYTISRFLIVKDRGTAIFEMPDILTFEIINPGDENLGWMGKKEGVIKPMFKWDISEQPINNYDKRD